MSMTRGDAGRLSRRRVDGVLLLDKPTGLTSNAALQRAKRLFRAEKAGHTGTLDPLASGLLPLCFGEATKFAQSLLDARKEYVATLRFGIATATGDAEGEVVGERPVAFSRARLEATLPGFVGSVRQTPPRHSALKLLGKSYYQYARAGVDIERVPRQVEIDAIEIVDCELPLVTLRVRCGKGTYIRVLAEEIGAAVDSCAHLAGLRRTASGAFELRDAIGLDALEVIDSLPTRDAQLLPVEALVAALPRLDVGVTDAQALAQGRPIPTALGPGRYRCHAPERFVGVVRVADGAVRAQRMLRTD